MYVEQFVRKRLLRMFTGLDEVQFRNIAPSSDELREKIQKTNTLGLYLHIPFCERICPYCPYNKELYRSDLAAKYIGAVKKEIDLYADIVENKEFNSFYIGGGTPTTMLHSGLADLIDHIRKTLNLRCGVHMESHPNHLIPANLDMIGSLGVQHLSIGVEALFDRHLKTLRRPYTAQEVKAAVVRAVASGFECVNVDVMFDLPDQTLREVEQTGLELVALGVDQVAAYPLFLFPYTAFGKTNGTRNHGLLQSIKRRRMLAILERVFYEAGYERTSAWAFTRPGVPRYCSVTVPAYLGLGASGASYFNDVFYVNTFGVASYVQAIDQGKLPIALSIELSARMQRAGWLYWRVYETRFRKSDYRARFSDDIDATYGGYLRLLSALGFLKVLGDQIVLTDRGSFWLHAFEDVLSIDYVSKLWGASRQEFWPERVIL